MSGRPFFGPLPLQGDQTQATLKPVHIVGELFSRISMDFVAILNGWVLLASDIS